MSGFKSAMGPAGQGKEWHHIVERTPGNVKRFGGEALHNTENITALGQDSSTRDVSAFLFVNPARKITDSKHPDRAKGPGTQAG